MTDRLAVLAGFVLSIASVAMAAEKPNFVVILADDLGYGDLSCYGNDRFETPHLDAMAKAGMRFTDFHSNCPVCSPTRAALLTGRYQQRAGIPGVVFADPKRGWRTRGLQPEEVTFAELLRDAGYATACYGKWHVGYLPKYNPVRQGFDEFRGYVSGNVDYRSHIDQAGHFDWWRDDELEDEEGYSTHLITRHAVEFIERSAKRPFCLYVAHEAPHYPLQGPDDPAFRTRGDAKVRAPKNENPRATYAEMILAMDDGIGEIRRTLERAKIAENTLVVFFSDNGATSLGRNLPLRGTKGSVWEGGHRVPAIAEWPGRIAAGSETDALAIGMDLMPTMLDLAGVPRPAGRPLDGVSLVPVLTGDGEPAERTLFWEFSGQAAVRRGRWKYVVPKDGRKPVLFDLGDDLAETKNVAADQPEQAAQLTAALAAWRKDVATGATVQPAPSK